MSADPGWVAGFVLPGVILVAVITDVLGMVPTGVATGAVAIASVLFVLWASRGYLPRP